MLNTQYIFALLNGLYWTFYSDPFHTVGWQALGASSSRSTGGATQTIMLVFDFMLQTHALMDVVCGLLHLGDIDIPLMQAKDFIPECCNISVDAAIPPFIEMMFLFR